jgi:hypothetical protein
MIESRAVPSTLDYKTALDAFKSMTDFINGVISAIRQRKESNDKQDEELYQRRMKALESLTKATQETAQYLARIRENPSTRSSEKQTELAALWGHAAFDIHFIDPQLARLYLRKGDYWSDPEGWTTTQKEDRELQLDRVSKLGRKALL